MRELVRQNEAHSQPSLFPIKVDHWSLKIEFGESIGEPCPSDTANADVLGDLNQIYGRFSWAAKDNSDNL